MLVRPRGGAGLPIVESIKVIEGRVGVEWVLPPESDGGIA